MSIQHQPMDDPWIREYADGVPLDLGDMEPLSMPDMLARAVARYGDRPALSLGSEVWTYRDYAALVARCARGLQDIGVAPGDRVAVLMPNHVVGSIWFFGVITTGAALVSINPLYTAAASQRSSRPHRSCVGRLGGHAAGQDSVRRRQSRHSPVVAACERRRVQRGQDIAD